MSFRFFLTVAGEKPTSFRGGAAFLLGEKGR